MYEKKRVRLQKNVFWMKLLLFFAFLAVWMLIPSLKAGAWERMGDASGSGDSFSLTQYTTRSAGGVRKNVPIDTRRGFTLSFEYWMGDSANEPRNGIMAVFSDSLVHSERMAYATYGYWDYVGTPVRFYGVEFNTYGICPSDRCLYERHAGILCGDSNSVFHMESCMPSGGMLGTWHQVKIVYNGSVLSVYQDNEFLMGASADLPDLCYVGITAGTSYYGYQRHQIRKLRISATDAVRIAFSANGGKCPVSRQYVLSAYSSKLPVPTRKGYAFQGWYTAAKGGAKIIPSRYWFKNGQKLYAHWKAKRYQITFHANGGKTPAGKKTVTFNKACGKLPVPTRTKGTFLGWYTAKTGGTKYTSSTVYKTAGNKTLYAHWRLVKYKVTFNGNGGRSSVSQRKVGYGNAVGTLPTASRSGYSFRGWYTKRSGGTKVSSSYKITKNTTLYAHWKKYSGGGSGGGGSTGIICATCRGTGRCRNCDGSGFIYRYTSGGRIRSNCPSCLYGRCRICGGDGRL